eukprot:360082-Chlamydomonas_euryale.AAC.5
MARPLRIRLRRRRRRRRRLAARRRAGRQHLVESLAAGAAAFQAAAAHHAWREACVRRWRRVGAAAVREETVGGSSGRVGIVGAQPGFALLEGQKPCVATGCHPPVCCAHALATASRRSRAALPPLPLAHLAHPATQPSPHAWPPPAGATAPPRFLSPVPTLPPSPSHNSTPLTPGRRTRGAAPRTCRPSRARATAAVTAVVQGPTADPLPRVPAAPEGAPSQARAGVWPSLHWGADRASAPAGHRSSRRC